MTADREFNGVLRGDDSRAETAGCNEISNMSPDFGTLN
jgi:hypothetical protein